MLSKAFFLPEIGLGQETRTAYAQLAQALDEFVRKTFNEWTNTVDDQCVRKLDKSLMQKGAVQKDMLNMNFDK